MAGKWAPGDAANAFVRVLLWDAGAKLANKNQPPKSGGLDEADWNRTIAWFDGRCAYTDEVLVDDQTERDHAIPMNREHCGLHLFGNVLPATREANRRKAGKHYRDFLIEDPARLERIESFIRESEYWERVSVFGNLQNYCEAQYRSINALCRVNWEYLDRLLPEDLEDEADTAPLDSSRGPQQEGDTLPIVWDPPSPEGAFKVALLRTGRAWIVEVYRDGQRIEQPWDARRMSDSSSVIGNVRSKKNYRKNTWKRLGIQSLVVSVRRPVTGTR